jgi:hypothetical protein
MALNPKKCKVMDITHARAPLYFKYTINGAALEYVDRQRLLGIHLSSDLRWGVHTDTETPLTLTLTTLAQRGFYIGFPFCVKSLSNINACGKKE